jgi:hypothetical protein
MTGIVNSTGARSGVIGTTVGSVDLATATFPDGHIIRVETYDIGRATVTLQNWEDDDTVPLIDEGSEIFSQAYTPSTGDCDLLIEATIKVGEHDNVSNDMGVGLFISDNTNALQVQDSLTGYGAIHNAILTIRHKIASWGESAKTFSLRVQGVTRLNYSNATYDYATAKYTAAAYISLFVIKEIKTS